jgi:hypothetical protein
MDLDKESRLILLLSRIDLDGEAFNIIKKLFKEANWDNLIELSKKQGTSAIVYKNLLKFDNVPKGVLSKLEDIYHNLLRRNILMINELDGIIDGLKREGIEIITLKGALASESIFKNIGLYPSDDIDFLVKEEDIDKVKDFLILNGYKLNIKAFDEYRRYFIKEQYHINLSNNEFSVEPHWNLFMRYFDTPSDFWWEENMAIESNNRIYRILSPEKNILYLTFRFFNKGFRQLRFLLLINETIRYYENILDWEKLFNYAIRFRFESVLRVSLKMCKDVFSLKIPEEYVKLKKLRVRLISLFAQKMILREREPHPFYKFLFIFLRDNNLGVFKIILRRIFPSKGEIIQRYRLDPFSYKIYLYYIFNPFLILLRRHER